MGRIKINTVFPENHPGPDLTQKTGWHRIRFSHFLFSDIHSAYPFLPLSSLKNGEFDSACQSDEILKYDLVVISHSHQNFEKGNVFSVSACGLEGASYLIIDVNGDGVRFERFFLSF